jgi:hypothetical protein
MSHLNVWYLFVDYVDMRFRTWAHVWPPFLFNKALIKDVQFLLRFNLPAGA